MNNFVVKIFIKISIYLLSEHISIKFFLVSFVHEALVNFIRVANDLVSFNLRFLASIQ